MYRRAFFDRLRSDLSLVDVDLCLVYGDATGDDVAKRDVTALDWGVFRRNRTASFKGRRLIWQPIWDCARGADLVIVEQASKLLFNYTALLAQAARLGPKVALWGHGANLQAHTASKVSESVKRRYSKLPHWWFAYTDGCRDRVAALGYPEERITVVQNAIDTRALEAQIVAAEAAGPSPLVTRLGLTPGRTGLFIGSLYREKRLRFLFEACDEIVETVPDFTLIVAGDGPERDDVVRYCRERRYARYLGRLDGTEKALALSAATVMLMPGLVGLAALDSFAASAPIVTTDLPFHSPEIEYVVSGVNGLVLPGSVGPPEYGATVARLLGSPRELSIFVEGCKSSARSLTVEEMARRFTEGVVRALEA